MSATSAAAAAAPRAAALPGPLDPTATVRFSSADGTGLYGEWFAPQSKPRAVALIVHGYAEHCGRYREVANVLVRAGLGVFSFDFRGHGRAEGQRGHVLSFAEYLDDLDAAVAQLDKQAREIGFPDAPVLLVAHSNGGLISLRALCDPARAPRRVRAAVITSPFLGLRAKVSPVKQVVGRLAARVVPTLSLPNELRAEDLTSDLDKQAERRADTLCHDVAGARWFLSAEQTQAHVLAAATRIRIPTIWIVGGDDPIADPSAARAVHARLGTPGEWNFMSGYKHEVLNERDRGRCYGLIETFVAKQFP
jgi:lysophospholipase